MRTILHSSERVTAGSADAALFIGFLLIFAVSAAYYVLRHGLEVRLRLCEVTDDGRLSGICLAFRRCVAGG